VNLASGTALARFTGPEYAQVVHTDGIRSLFTQVFDNQARLFTESSTPLVFGTNNTERARIDSSGDLLVGTTSSGATNARLRAVQASGSNSAFEATANDAAYAGTLVYNTTTRAASSSFDFDGFYANGVGQFRVSGNGVIYAQNTTVQSISDVRLKENIKDATDGLSVVSALRPVRYDWKTGFGNDGKNQLGFIAQEVEKVFPEAISEWKVNREDETVYKTVGPGSFIPVLVKAIQELKAEVDSLKSQLEGK
jgi:hypothetical protein